jgi:hypothetical protein
MSLNERYAAAPTFADFLDGAEKNQDLWRAIARRAAVPDEIQERIRALPGRWHLLVICDDWCGDGVNTLPFIAALAEAVPALDLRVVPRDENPDLMEAHLTNGSRSIPVVIVLDEAFQEQGWWGPRPTELQRWVIEEGLKLPSEERYREVRRWYARDGGRTTLEEIVTLLERCAAQVVV